MDRLALSRLIRYGINDLAARNGHHAFEEMCRFLVAARITSNVFPATGPVSGGGDGGRDFQTFATNLQNELGPHRGFAALASGDVVAFACTLQSKGVPTKIRRDLKKIAAGEPSAPKVYALVGADLKTSKATELKTEAKEKYEIELEILDGQAIAELLSHHDTFWIAARWLAIPAENAPDPPEDEAGEAAWYVDIRERWRKAEHAPMTMGELMEVRDGLRRSVFHKHARPDLSLWLNLMSQATGDKRPPHLRQRARYETAFGQLRGAGDLQPADGHVRDYLEQLDAAQATWAELLDASVLLQYVIAAALRGRTKLTAAWIKDENGRLREAVEKRLRQKELTLTQECGFLDVLGHLRAHIDPTTLELPDEPLRAHDPLIDDNDLTGKVVPSSVPMIDPDGAISAWTKFARLAPKAPLVPVDSLSEVIAFLTPALVDRSGFRELVELLDGVQAELGGDAAAAERSRDRALSLLEVGRPLDALVDLHEAKARWWHGDTMRGSLLALLLLARTYDELGLPMAARQHALVAVGLAHVHGTDEHGDLLASGLMRVAHLDYGMGAWCAAVESYSVAMLAHQVHAEDPWNVERHKDLAATYLHGGYMRAAAKLVGGDLVQRIRESQDEFGLSEVLDETENDLPSWDAFEWREHLVDELGTCPFADAGATRVIKWAALGINWEVRAFNDYGHCRAAERFAAAAQILCAELAQEDLVLIPTTIRIRVQATSLEQTQTRDRIRSEPGNEGSDWLVDLIPLARDGGDVDPQELSSELTVAIATVLYEASLTSWDRHEEILIRCFERGLPHKLSAGRPYDDAAGVVTKEHFQRIAREQISLPPEWREVPVPNPVEALLGQDGPGPGYSKEKSAEMIGNRYLRFREILCETLPRLADDADFQATYRHLQSLGWKDWHVLMALANARLNFRAQGSAQSLEEMRESLRSNPQHPPETPDEPQLPPEWLTVERLTELRRFAFMTGTVYWDLDVHQQTPDLEAVEELLGQRYGYWTDDVNHPPLF